MSDGRERGSPAPPLWPRERGASWHLSKPQLFQGDNKRRDQYINACTLLLVWDLGFRRRAVLQIRTKQMFLESSYSFSKSYHDLSFWALGALAGTKLEI